MKPGDMEPCNGLLRGLECGIPCRLVRIQGAVGTQSHVVLRSTIYTRAFHVIRGYVIGTIRQCPQHRLGPGVFGISFDRSHRTQESRWAEIGLGHIGTPTALTPVACFAAPARFVPAFVRLRSICDRNASSQHKSEIGSESCRESVCQYV